MTPSVYADMWVPYTSMPLVMGASDERDVSVGLLTVCILPADGMGVDEVSRELEEMIGRYNTTLASGLPDAPVPDPPFPADSGAEPVRPECFADAGPHLRTGGAEGFRGA